MAHRISLHEIVDAIDKTLAQLDELDEKGIGPAGERARASSTLKQVRANLLELCEDDDPEFTFMMVNA